MATWKLLPAGPTPGGQFSDGSTPGITVACGFTVTEDGCSCTGVWFRATDTIDSDTTFTIELWQYTAASTNTGTRLAVAAFDDSEITAGVWQELLFSSPVALDQAERYAASINYGNATTVRYCATTAGFSSGETQGPLTGWADSTTVLGVASMRNNVFRDGSAPGSGSFPGNAFGSPSYSVSPIVDDGAGGSEVDVTGSAPLGGLTATGDIERAVSLAGAATLGGLSASVDVERAVSLTGTAALAGLTATGALSRSVALSGAAPLGGLTAAGVISGGAAAVMSVRIGGQLVETAMVGAVRIGGVAVEFG